MSDIQDELNRRLINCVKRETGFDLADQDVISELSQEDSAVIKEYGLKCALKMFKNIGKDKFRKWLLKEYEQIEEEATRVGNRIIRFSSKIDDPVNVYTELSLMTTILENLVTDIDDEDLFSDKKSLLRLLVITALEEVRKRIFINSLRPQLFTMGLAQLTLGKDYSWCTSVLSLTIEEQFIKKKAVEFGIDIEEDENYYSILKKLTSYMDENNIRQSRELLLADSHRKIRNKVLHENWNPTEDEMDDIIAHVLKITQFFSSRDWS